MKNKVQLFFCEACGSVVIRSAQHQPCKICAAMKHTNDMSRYYVIACDCGFFGFVIVEDDHELPIAPLACPSCSSKDFELFGLIPKPLRALRKDNFLVPPIGGEQ